MTAHRIEFEVKAQKIRGNLYLPAQSKKMAVLFIHGWTGHPNDAAAQTLYREDFATMTFSLRGHNDSDGRLEDVTRKGSLEDVIAAYDYFKSKLPAGTEIVAAGSSYGSYLAALLSKKRKLFSMSLRVPANYPDYNFDKPQLPQAPGDSNSELQMWRQKMIDYKDTASLTAIHDFEGDIQIIEAGDDEVVPHQTVQNYVDAVSDKSKLDYHLVRNWPHSLGDDQERNRTYQRLILKWLNEES